MNRRSLFSLAPAALVAVAAPALAQPSDPWDALSSALAVINPALADKAREAQAAGYHPNELTLVHNDTERPMLLFRREYGPNAGPRAFDGAH